MATNTSNGDQVSKSCNLFFVMIMQMHVVRLFMRCLWLWTKFSWLLNIWDLYYDYEVICLILYAVVRWHEPYEKCKSWFMVIAK